MRNLVLFDFDGTIADSMMVALEVYNDLAPGLGIPTISTDDARLRTMNPRDALKASGIPLWKVPSLLSGVRSGMKARMHAIRLFPGMDRTVSELGEAGFRCGIVSSNSRENIEAFLARHRMDQLEILGAGTSLFGKPSMLRKVLRREGVEPKHAFYVGDEVRDIAAAAELGMRSIAVSWGYADRSALAAMRPDVLVDTPDELARSLVRLAAS